MSEKNTYNQIIKEYFSSDYQTVKKLMSLNEAEKNTVLTHTSSQIYSAIINKVDQIDFGEIPKSKGDISRVPNIVEIRNCIESVREMILQFKEPTVCPDIILKAMDNVRNGKAIFERAFNVDNGLGIIMYNSIVLSIISATSLMISTSVEFIKDPSGLPFKAQFDRVALHKTKDHLLFKDLETFNKRYDDIMKAIKESNSKVISHRESAEQRYEGLDFMVEFSGGTLLTIGATILLIANVATLILPLLHSLVCFFFNARQKVSDYFEAQAVLLDMNIETLKYEGMKSDASRKQVIEKQQKIATKFHKIANKLAVKMKTAEVEAEKEIKRDKENKMDYNDIEDSLSSSLF